MSTVFYKKGASNNMKYISRSQFIAEKITAFTNSKEETCFIDLYKSEISRTEKKFPEIEISIGPRTNASFCDQRYACIVRKKNN